MTTRFISFALVTFIGLSAATESTARGFLRRNQNNHATGDDVLEEIEAEQEPSFDFYTFAYHDRCDAHYIRDGRYLKPGAKTENLEELATVENLPDVNVTVEGINGPNENVLLPYLHYAVWYGRVSLVEALLKRGANPNARDYNGWTAQNVFEHRQTALSETLSSADFERLQDIFPASVTDLERQPSNATSSTGPFPILMALSSGIHLSEALKMAPFS